MTSLMSVWTCPHSFPIKTNIFCQWKKFDTWPLWRILPISQISLSTELQLKLIVFLAKWWTSEFSDDSWLDHPTILLTNTTGRSKLGWRTQNCSGSFHNRGSSLPFFLFWECLNRVGSRVVGENPLTLSWEAQCETTTSPKSPGHLAKKLTSILSGYTLEVRIQISHCEIVGMLFLSRNDGYTSRAVQDYVLLTSLMTPSQCIPECLSGGDHQLRTSELVFTMFTADSWDDFPWPYPSVDKWDREQNSDAPLLIQASFTSILNYSLPKSWWMHLIWLHFFFLSYL